jgi:hypothetical protein
MIKSEVLYNVQMKYDVNRINIRIFTQQVGWPSGKGIELHHYNPKIKFHK